MLPFTKRPSTQPQESSQNIKTDEIEVVSSSQSLSQSQSSSSSYRPPERPRVFEKSLSDDEMTQFMPPKSPTVPPARPSVRPVQGTSSRPSVRPARSGSEETVVRASASIPPPSRVPRIDTPGTAIQPAAVMHPGSVPPPPRSNPSMQPQAQMQPQMQTAGMGMQPHGHLLQPPMHGVGVGFDASTVPPWRQPQHLSGSMHSAPPPPMGSVGSMYPAPMHPSMSGHLPAYSSQQMPASPMSSQQLPHLGPHSDPRFDPPAIAMTTRTNINGRPTMSWAAALMAMGLLVGLVTAVVARGDADSLIDATASFVDPSHAPAAKAAAAPAETTAPAPDTATPPPQAQPIAPPPQAQEPPVAATAAPPPAADPAAPPPAAVPAPPGPAPTSVNAVVATASPVVATPPPPAPAPQPVAAPEPKPEPKVAVAPRPEPRPQPVVRPQPAPQPVAQPRPRPVAKAPVEDEDPPAKPAKKGAPKKGSSADDEAAAQAAKLAQEQLEQSLK